MQARIEDKSFHLSRTGTHEVKLGDRTLILDALWVEPGVLSLLIDGQSYNITVTPEKIGYTVYFRNHEFRVCLEDPQAPSLCAGTARTAEEVVSSPMPGRIIGIRVRENETVEEGQGLLILEAMKMANEIPAPRAGWIQSIHVRPGDVVAANQNLLVIGK